MPDNYRYSEFGRLLKRYREQNDLTQEGLLNELRSDYHQIWSKATICKWEKGIHRPRSISIVKDLQDMLGVPNDKLLIAAEYKTPTEPSAVAEQCPVAGPELAERRCLDLVPREVPQQAVICPH